MKIKSKYFTLEELTRTNTGLLNIPSIKEVANLQDLVTNILDPLRELYEHPIIKKKKKKVAKSYTHLYTFNQHLIHMLYSQLSSSLWINFFL